MTFENFMTLEQLQTFTGSVAAVLLLTGFLKGLYIAVINYRDKDIDTEIYKLFALVSSMFVVFIFNYQGGLDTQEILLGFLNSLVLSAAAMGTYNVSTND